MNKEEMGNNTKEDNVETTTIDKEETTKESQTYKEIWEENKPRTFIQWVWSIFVWILMLSFVVNVVASIKDFDNSHFGQIFYEITGSKNTYENIVLEAETKYGYTVKDALNYYFEGNVDVNTISSEYGLIVQADGTRVENGIEHEYLIQFITTGEEVGDFKIYMMTNNYIPLNTNEMYSEFNNILSYKAAYGEHEETETFENTGSDYNVSIAMNEGIVNDIVMYSNESEIQSYIEELGYKNDTLGNILNNKLEGYTFSVESIESEYVFSVTGNIDNLTVKLVFNLIPDSCTLNLVDVYASNVGDSNSERITNKEFKKLHLL